MRTVYYCFLPRALSMTIHSDMSITNATVANHHITIRSYCPERMRSTGKSRTDTESLGQQTQLERARANRFVLAPNCADSFPMVSSGYVSFSATNWRSSNFARTLAIASERLRFTTSYYVDGAIATGLRIARLLFICFQATNLSRARALAAVCVRATPNMLACWRFSLLSHSRVYGCAQNAPTHRVKPHM